MNSIPEMESSNSENISFNNIGNSPTAMSVSNSSSPSSSTAPSRYENQKRRDWNTFGQYLKNHRPPLSLSRCSGAHVLEFLRYLDQFGKTKVHTPICPFYGHPNPPAPCPCPLRQAWGSLDALIGRLRAAFEENGGKPEANPFGARAVRLYLREVRDLQSKARGVSYEKKKRKRPPQQQIQSLPLPLPLPEEIYLAGKNHNMEPGGGSASAGLIESSTSMKDGEMKNSDYRSTKPRTHSQEKNEEDKYNKLNYIKSLS